MIRTAIIAAALLAWLPAIAETVEGSAIAIIDGDTVALPAGPDGVSERIRLVEIDAPESFRSACEAELVAGLRAKERLRALLKDQPVSIERAGRDRYSRTLARLVTPAGDVGAILVAESLALPYRPGRKAERTDHWCGRAR